MSGETVTPGRCIALSPRQLDRAAQGATDPELRVAVHELAGQPSPDPVSRTQYPDWWTERHR